jgi:integrase
MMKVFRSCFSEHLKNYVQLRKGLGLKFDTQANILLNFDRYCYQKKHNGLLDMDTVLDFIGSNSTISSNERARIYQVIRHFTDYLVVYEPDTPYFPPSLFTRAKSRPCAYIYTEQELTLLLKKAKNISAKSPLRGITLHAIIGLAASTGLRVSEVVRLDQSDVDLESGVITVRKTKFCKDRIVPVHPTVQSMLSDYASVRNEAFSGCSSDSFFINMWKRRFSKHTLQCAFRDLLIRVGIRKGRGNGPSFHDLRHSFAVRRLTAWYKEGKDVQAMLPVLATYMGHVHYSDTAWYLTATPELLAIASACHQEFLSKEVIL